MKDHVSSFFFHFISSFLYLAAQYKKDADFITKQILLRFLVD